MDLQRVHLFWDCGVDVVVAWRGGGNEGRGEGGREGGCVGRVAMPKWDQGCIPSRYLSASGGKSILASEMERTFPRPEASPPPSPPSLSTCTSSAGALGGATISSFV